MKKRPRWRRYTWAYRFRSLSEALGWSYAMIAQHMGISISVIHRCLRIGHLKKQPLLRLDIIRKILAIERLYADVLKRYHTKAYFYDRRPTAQKYLARKLQPIQVRRSDDLQALEVLETHNRAKDQEPKSKFPSEYRKQRKRDRYARTASSVARSWAREIAEGRDRYANYRKAQLGRPKPTGGGEGAVVAGVPKKKVFRKRWLIEAEIARKKKENGNG